MLRIFCWLIKSAWKDRVYNSGWKIYVWFFTPCFMKLNSIPSTNSTKNTSGVARIFELHFCTSLYDGQQATISKPWCRVELVSIDLRRQIFVCVVLVKSTKNPHPRSLSPYSTMEDRKYRFCLPAANCRVPKLTRLVEIRHVLLIGPIRKPQKWICYFESC